MTKETCIIQYNQAKKKGDKDAMKAWKDSFLDRGGDIKVLEPEAEKKEEKKKLK